MAESIVIFDSGVGGLSIYNEVKKALPWLHVIYCSDTEAFPYGSKLEGEVIERTSYCLNRLAGRFKPSLAVIACNTASTVSLPRTRRELTFPVIGVVPAIKTASGVSRNRCIGLLATPGTINRSYTNHLINDFADDCTVIRVGSSQLVHLSENHLRNKQISLKQIHLIIEPFLTHNPVPDTIVLGCTHFSLLKDFLRKNTPPSVSWIDSGSAIAARVDTLLKHPHPFRQQLDQFLYTGNKQNIVELIPTLKAMGFSLPSPLEPVCR